MLKPIQDNVCLRRVAVDKEMVNGLYVPDTAANSSNVGIIVALGTDPEMLETLKVGDKVIYKEYAGVEVEFEDEVYLMVKFSDILCIIEK